jgi:uncharacterized protein YacL (UPF0231 family)
MMIYRMVDKTIELTFEDLKELLIRAGKNGFNSYESHEAGLEYYDAEVVALWIMRGLKKKEELNN